MQSENFYKNNIHEDEFYIAQWTDGYTGFVTTGVIKCTKISEYENEFNRRTYSFKPNVFVMDTPHGMIPGNCHDITFIEKVTDKEMKDTSIVFISYYEYVRKVNKDKYITGSYHINCNDIKLIL